MSQPSPNREDSSDLLLSEFRSKIKIHDNYIFQQTCVNTKNIPKYVTRLCVYVSLMAFISIFLLFDSFPHESLTCSTKPLKAHGLIHFSILYCILNVVMNMEGGK